MRHEKLRIAVTGCRGQIVSALIERASKKIDIITLGRPQLDLSKPASAMLAVKTLKCDIIINAAAYTQVDNAEDEVHLAMKINSDGPKYIAAAAAELNIPLIQLSTDYVFDGMLNRPYREQDKTAPLGIYGISKLNGENIISSILTNYLILRTSWIYSPFGTNFVKTMLKLAEDRDEVSVVSDQVGSPTSALDIADQLIYLSKRLVDTTNNEERGIFHLSGTGYATWADVAEFIFSIIQKNGGKTVKVKRIMSKDYLSKAARPKNSRLDNSKIKNVFSIEMPFWQESMESCVKRLYNKVIKE